MLTAVFVFESCDVLTQRWRGTLDLAKSRQVVEDAINLVRVEIGVQLEQVKGCFGLVADPVSLRSTDHDKSDLMVYW